MLQTHTCNQGHSSSSILYFPQKTIESETVKTSEVFKKTFGTLSETVKEGLEEVTRTDLGKKIKEGVKEAAKTARHSVESVSKGGEKLGATSAFRAISQVRD